MKKGEGRKGLSAVKWNERVREKCRERPQRLEVGCQVEAKVGEECVARALCLLKLGVAVLLVPISS